MAHRILFFSFFSVEKHFRLCVCLKHCPFVCFPWRFPYFNRRFGQRRLGMMKEQCGVMEKLFISNTEHHVFIESCSSFIDKRFFPLNGCFKGKSWWIKFSIDQVITKPAKNQSSKIAHFTNKTSRQVYRANGFCSADLIATEPAHAREIFFRWKRNNLKCFSKSNINTSQNQYLLTWSNSISIEF